MLKSGLAVEINPHVLESNNKSIVYHKFHLQKKKKIYDEIKRKKEATNKRKECIRRDKKRRRRRIIIQKDVKMCKYLKGFVSLKHSEHQQ